MNKRLLFITFIAIILITGGLLVFKIEEPKKVTLGISPFMGGLQSYIAFEKGFFLEEGLDVTFKINKSGKESFDQMLEGDIDIATCADLPLVYRSFNEPNFRVITSLMTSINSSGIVANKLSGITTPKDLVNKRIGIFKGTDLDYFMDVYFKHHEIDISTVEIINIKPEDQIKTMSNNEIDAMISWEAYLDEAEKTDDRFIRFDSQNLNTLNWVATARVNYINKHPDVIKAYLEAMIKADNFIANNPEEAVEIFSKKTNSDKEKNYLVYSSNLYKLNLYESLIRNMESKANWALKTGRVDGDTIPEFLDLIYFEAMEEVDSESITIIH